MAMTVTAGLIWYSPCGYEWRDLFLTSSPVPTCPQCQSMAWSTFPPYPTLDAARDSRPAGADHPFHDEWSFQRSMSRGNEMAGKPIAPDQPCFDCDVPFSRHGRDSRPVGEGLTPARFWQLALAKSIDGLVIGDAWEAAAAIKGRLDSRGVVLAVDPVANPIGLSTDQSASTEAHSGPADAQTCTVDIGTGVCGWYKDLHVDADRGHAFEPPYRT